MRISPKGLSAAIALAVVSSGVTSQVQASGFALIENSASGMGNAFAGGSAIADDASTVYFNPAGMTRLSGSQIIVAGHFISTAADYTDTGSTTNPLLPGGGGSLPGSNDDGGTSSLVPNFYYVTELGNDSFFGIGITVPFGLATEYDDGWVGRYTAVDSEVQTININPSFAARATDKLSVGFGLSIQYIEATLSNQLDSAAICLKATASVDLTTCNTLMGTTATLASEPLDSSQSLSGDDWSIGWNIGVLYDLDEKSRLGVAYRSSVKQDLEGEVDFTQSAALTNFLTAVVSPLFVDTGITASIELPETLSASYYRDVNDKLALMADITWTRWSNFDELVINFDNSQPTATIPENWDDSYRFALGINYRQDSSMIYRAGIAYDQTPIPSAEDRTPRIPGDNRTWLSFGLGYNFSADMSMDIGYSHLFVSDTDINNTDASFEHTVTGTYEADVNILSAQLNFNF
ncbi:MAG: OmpP1/FadL family transporter [Gammaproteobacteria bacterium]